MAYSLQCSRATRSALPPIRHRPHTAFRLRDWTTSTASTSRLVNQASRAPESDCRRQSTGGSSGGCPSLQLYGQGRSGHPSGEQLGGAALRMDKLGILTRTMDRGSPSYTTWNGKVVVEEGDCKVTRARPVQPDKTLEGSDGRMELLFIKPS